MARKSFQGLINKAGILAREAQHAGTEVEMIDEFVLEMIELNPSNYDYTMCRHLTKQTLKAGFGPELAKSLAWDLKLIVWGQKKPAASRATPSNTFTPPAGDTPRKIDGTESKRSN